MNLLARKEDKYKQDMKSNEIFVHIVLSLHALIGPQKSSKHFDLLFCHLVLFLNPSCNIYAPTLSGKDFATKTPLFTAFYTIEDFSSDFSPSSSIDPHLDKLTHYSVFFIQSNNYMPQLCKNILTDFLGQIFLELSKFITWPLFRTPCRILNRLSF